MAPRSRRTYGRLHAATKPPILHDMTLRIAALVIVLLAVSACAGVAPSGDPYEHGCEFNYRCNNPG